MRLTLAVWSLFALGVPLGAQGSRAELEAVSVKLNKSMQQSSGNRFGPTRMSWTNESLEHLIETAYDIKAHQIVGAPSWASSDRWNIEATTNVPTTSDEKYALLQRILQTRFNLKFHWTTKDLPGYRLVVSKSGPKFRASDPKQSPPPSGGTVVDRGLIKGSRISMSSFVYFLSIQLERPVIDATGLRDEYQFNLEWDHNYRHSSTDDDEQGGKGSLFTALQEQLGLKLQSTKTPMRILVVDEVGRADEN